MLKIYVENFGFLLEIIFQSNIKINPKDQINNKIVV